MGKIMEALQRLREFDENDKFIGKLKPIRNVKGGFMENPISANLSFNIKDAIEDLKRHRKIFTSEADFRDSFAQTCRNLFSCKVLLEQEIRGKDGKTRHMDMLLVTKEGKNIGFEFKYITAPIEVSETNDNVEVSYSLVNHSSQDSRRYDSMKDIARLEDFKEKGVIDDGYFIQITNDPLYWKDSKNIDKADAYSFSMRKGIKAGSHDWRNQQGSAKRNLPNPINIKNDYSADDVAFSDYSDFKDKKYGKFKIRIVKIK